VRVLKGGGGSRGKNRGEERGMGRGLEGDDAVCEKTGLIFDRPLEFESVTFLENFSANRITGFDWQNFLSSS
jgi:hypothetical protein